MDEALRYIREAMDDVPERDRYFLAKLLADLVLEKVRPADVADTGWVVIALEPADQSGKK